MAATVVLAVDGTGDSSSDRTIPGGPGPGTPGQPSAGRQAASIAALASDAAAIRTAEALSYATSGSYADVAGLVRAGFLAEPSRYHEVIVTDEGQAYRLVCLPLQPCEEPTP